MAFVGYARVSSVGQSLEVQQEKLVSYGVDKLFAEKLSGTTAARPELKSCLDYVREGDVLVITKLDRLARSTLHLHKIVNDLNNRGVGFKVLDQIIHYLRFTEMRTMAQSNDILSRLSRETTTWPTKTHST